MREQASASALRERSQDSCGGEGAKMKTLQVGGGGRQREADLLAGEHSGANQRATYFPEE